MHGEGEPNRSFKAVPIGAIFLCDDGDVKSTGEQIDRLHTVLANDTEKSVV